MQRKGQYPPPTGVTNILGLEAAGEIVQVGQNAKEKWNIGDKVQLIDDDSIRIHWNSFVGYGVDSRWRLC